MAARDIFVIGASAGGVEALSQIVAGLPEDFPGSVFVVLHTLAGGESHLSKILDRRGVLPAVPSQDGMTIQPGTIYVAVPNHHLMIEQRQVRSVTGPRENGHRPSVNVLFESAARSSGSRVVGIVLSGSLDDGTRGLHAIKNAGGLAIVQHPEDAAFASMPRSALANVAIDYIGSSSEIARFMSDIARSELELEPVANPGEHQPARAESTHQVANSVDDVGGFSCPECGGVLKEETSGNLSHFRCHVGHTFSEQTLLNSHGELVEKALWTALRVLDERMSLTGRAMISARDRGNNRVADRLKLENNDVRQKAALIRRILLGSDENAPLTELQEQPGEVESPDNG
ncbi:MAG: chemotaxis protein CheB [Sphaerobacteraceae bacterium]|nr:MAG: chemotaxis protein CheB [Sphaerobacteraceae bacterium]